MVILVVTSMQPECSLHHIFSLCIGLATNHYLLNANTLTNMFHNNNTKYLISIKYELRIRDLPEKYYKGRGEIFQEGTGAKICPNPKGGTHIWSNYKEGHLWSMMWTMCLEEESDFYQFHASSTGCKTE